MRTSIQCQVEVDRYEYDPHTGRIYDVKLVVEDPAFCFESTVDFDKLTLQEQQSVLHDIQREIDARGTGEQP